MIDLDPKGLDYERNTNQKEDDTPFIAVEEMPVPIDGIEGIQNRIKYPEEALQQGIEGKVYVLAFVDEWGDVEKAQVLKGIGGGCDEAALKAVKETKFIPGKHKGNYVKVQVSVPIIFKLN